MFRTLIACLCLSAPAPALAADDVPSVAWIVAEEGQGIATLDVFARFPEAEGVRYSLAIEKRGGGGRSSTRQAGTLGAREGGIARILHNTHSFGGADRIVIDLTVTAADGTVLREQQVTLGDADR